VHSTTSVLDDITNCGYVDATDRVPGADQLMDPQLDAEGRLIEAGDAIRFDAVQDPQVADVLKQRRSILRARWWPGVGHSRDRSADAASKREGRATRDVIERFQAGARARNRIVTRGSSTLSMALRRPNVQMTPVRGVHWERREQSPAAHCIHDCSIACRAADRQRSCQLTRVTHPALLLRLVSLERRHDDEG